MADKKPPRIESEVEQPKDTPKAATPSDKPSTIQKEDIQSLIAAIKDIKDELEKVKSEKSQLEKKVEEQRISNEQFLKSGATPKDEERHKSKKEITKEHLQKQPQVPVFIPTLPNEVAGKTIHPVTINGYRLNIPKGVYINVPQDVAKLVMDSMNQTAKALESKYRIDKDTSVEKLEAMRPL